MEITKLRLKDGILLAEWSEKNKLGNLDDFRVESADRPEPELIKAFEALAPEVVDLLDLPKDWGERHGLRVLGATFEESEKQGIGATLTAEARLPRSDAKLTMNTPMSWQYGKGGSMRSKTAEKLKLLRMLGARFVEGHRAQGQLPLSVRVVVSEKDEGETVESTAKAGVRKVLEDRGVTPSLPATA